MQCVRRASSTSARHLLGRRCLHATRSRHAITAFAMPAMSPTMTEGGIAEWQKKEGEAFSSGDVLVEVETDKATIDVEAQDDGILGKIIAPDGAKNVPVGKIIALLAEEGDDISNLEAPNEDAPKVSEIPKGSQAPEQPLSQHSGREFHIQHLRPLFPSVNRLLVENNIENADEIKGTGVRGMLTKGDVLTFLGKTSSPLGTYKAPKSETREVVNKPKEEMKPLNGQAIRRLIVTSFLQSSKRTCSIPLPITPYTFDSIIADYLPSNTTSPPPKATPSPKQTSFAGSFRGLI